jgi:sugar lactone lactonase YvrE
MDALNIRRRMIHLTMVLVSVMVLSGCSGSGNSSSVPFSALTSTSLDGTGSMARFFSPTGITNDGSNLYVADTANNTIRQVVISSGVVTTLAGTARVKGTTDGTGAAAQFSSPYGITTDGTNLYVTDTGNNTIRQVVISSGVVTTLAGTAGVKGTTDGTGAAAQFSSPYGITTDGTNLYVTDTGNNTIRQVVIASGTVTTLAGAAGTSGTLDGTGTAAQFSSPYGITTDGTNLYVADTLNNTIRKVVIASGVVNTLAGTAGSSGATDGTGTATLFNHPFLITSDGTNLYVPDTHNNTIRKIEITTGVVTTLAGTAGTSGSSDGTGATALFKSPIGITTDATNLYVTDTGNNTIRKVVIATGAVTTLAGKAR